MGRVHVSQASFPEAGWSPPFLCAFGEHDSACEAEQFAGGFTDRTQAVVFAIGLDEFA